MSEYFDRKYFGIAKHNVLFKQNRNILKQSRDVIKYDVQECSVNTFVVLLYIYYTDLIMLIITITIASHFLSIINTNY